MGQLHGKNARRKTKTSKGNFKVSLNAFKNQMKDHAKSMEFEKAQLIKEKIDYFLILVNLLVFIFYPMQMSFPAAPNIMS